ncbi:DUF2304 domain-containing protein [Microbacterium sp. MYb62]|uniref:DUF2304 domain-containing protein n=1 Tax=Microbacterium sp. MYb62 TaxID=1848690 RepID=UPI000CFB668E|nr:DUF2304 domain-containing protein [Microbacterium sp. MYb62]PRB15143.1 hypothetical protein CQ042_09345 [Microbacterium sp. MYb62]
MIVVLGIALSLLALGLVGWMLLTRRIQEKYAVLWIIIALCVLVLGLFPQLLLWATALIGVQLPVNLLFALAILLLLGVALHLSWEISRAEDEIRRLAEEAAISRAVVDQLRDRVDALEERATGAKDSTEE